MTDRSRTRSLVARSVFAIASTLIALGIVVSACGETRRSFGDDCLKNEDCLSNICDSLRCAADPPALGTPPAPTNEAGPTTDAATDADGASDAPTGDAVGDVVSAD